MWRSEGEVWRECQREVGITGRHGHQAVMRGVKAQLRVRLRGRVKVRVEG